MAGGVATAIASTVGVLQQVAQFLRGLHAGERFSQTIGAGDVHVAHGDEPRIGRLERVADQIRAPVAGADHRDSDRLRRLGDG